MSKRTWKLEIVFTWDQDEGVSMTMNGEPGKFRGSQGIEEAVKLWFADEKGQDQAIFISQPDLRGISLLEQPEASPVPG